MCFSCCSLVCFSPLPEFFGWYMYRKNSSANLVLIFIHESDRVLELERISGTGLENQCALDGQLWKDLLKSNLFICLNTGRTCFPHECDLWILSLQHIRQFGSSAVRRFQESGISDYDKRFSTVSMPFLPVDFFIWKVITGTRHEQCARYSGSTAVHPTFCGRSFERSKACPSTCQATLSPELLSMVPSRLNEILLTQVSANIKTWLWNPGLRHFNSANKEKLAKAALHIGKKESSLIS